MKKTTNSGSIIRIISFTFLMIVGMSFASSVLAADITYNVETGDWADAKWTPQAPAAGDNVIIPLGAVVTVSTDLSTTIFNKVTVNGKLIISAEGKLDVQQTVLASPIFDISGGEVINSGSLSVKQTLANTSTVVLGFTDNATNDSKMTTSGTLSLDNTASSNTGTSGKCISFTQSSPDRVSKLTFGGTLVFNGKTGARFIEVMTGAKAEFDGTAVIGSSSDYKNFRFMHFGSSATVTIAPTADITFYSGFVSSNGAITFSNSIVVSFTNKGKLTILGGPAVTGYGLYLNPQYASPNTGSTTFTNEGTLIIDGNFPLGCIYLNGGVGGTGTTVTFNNQLGAVTTLINTGTATTAVPIRASATLTTAFNNAGTMNLSSTALDASIGAGTNTYTNTGIVNFNYVAGVNNVFEFNGKIYFDGYDIKITLPANEKAQFILTDITGRTLKAANIQNENNTISTNNLKGIFIVRLLTAKGGYSQKISLN